MKPATIYYSTAIPHPEIPGGYWAKFSIVGANSEWVLDYSGSRRVFATKDEAELAGYRAMAMRMNRVGSPKTPVVRAVRPPIDEKRVVNQRAAQSEVARVFARFKKPGSDKA